MAFLATSLEFAVGGHHIGVAVHHLEVDMKSAAGLSGSDFRSESYVISLLHGKGADYPFGNHKVVGGLHCRDRKEFDFVLLEYLAVDGEVAYFVVAILYLSVKPGL